MKNLLSHAYFIELVWFIFALSAFVLALWMFTSTKADRAELHKFVKHNGRAIIPGSFYVQADGNFFQEVWRVLEALGLLIVSIWFTFFHSLDGKPVIFWSFWDNMNPSRLLAVYITWCNLGAGLTARWFRHRASELD